MQNLEEWYRSTGFLFPMNELELARFNKLYKQYNFKLKNKSIDVESIIKGRFCLFGAKSLQIKKIIESPNDISELKMVARKGQEVPKNIIDKMTQKHRKKNDEKNE